MAWTYNPADAIECLPEGDYQAELAKVEEKTSKAGNPMLEVTWSVFDNGKTKTVRDYIVQPSGLFKMKQIARAWSMLNEFESGDFDLAAHVGKMAELHLTVESSDKYSDRNQVAGFRAASHARPTPAPQTAQADSEIPF